MDDVHEDGLYIDRVLVPDVAEQEPTLALSHGAVGEEGAPFARSLDAVLLWTVEERGDTRPDCALDYVQYGSVLTGERLLLWSDRSLLTLKPQQQKNHHQQQENQQRENQQQGQSLQWKLHAKSRTHPLGGRCFQTVCPPCLLRMTTELWLQTCWSRSSPRLRAVVPHSRLCVRVSFPFCSFPWVEGPLLWACCANLIFSFRLILLRKRVAEVKKQMIGLCSY
jgi:hypothetical protein